LQNHTPPPFFFFSFCFAIDVFKQILVFFIFQKKFFFNESGSEQVGDISRLKEKGNRSKATNDTEEKENMAHINKDDTVKNGLLLRIISVIMNKIRPSLLTFRVRSENNNGKTSWNRDVPVTDTADRAVLSVAQEIVSKLEPVFHFSRYRRDPSLVTVGNAEDIDAATTNQVILDFLPNSEADNQKPDINDNEVLVVAIFVTYQALENIMAAFSVYRNQMTWAGTVSGNWTQEAAAARGRFRQLLDFKTDYLLKKINSTLSPFADYDPEYPDIGYDGH
jgi:hypothetical protein